MNSFFNMMNNPLFQIMQQVRQIKQNPSLLASLLQQRGMISPQQAKEIEQMGGNYEQIGYYLINNGKMPQNYHQYDGTVNEVQNMMNDQR